MPTATPPDASLYHLSDVPSQDEDNVLSATARVSLHPEMRPHDFLACVEGHFQRSNDIEAALELYTDDIIFEAPLSMASMHFSVERKTVAKFYQWATMSALISGHRLRCALLETQLPPNKGIHRE